MTFVLAHLSDPHVGPLPTPRWRDLAGKRLTGYWNWRSSRRTIHDMDVLSAICDDVAAHQPDHVALTGDLVNIGLPTEFPLAHRLLAALGGPEAVSVIPGNHDAYVHGSFAAMARVFGPHMMGDDGTATFPYLRMRGGIAFVGLSSGVPTAPFLATGTIGAAQLQRLDVMLDGLRRAHTPVVVMIHHPPTRGGARFARGLTDAAALEKVLARRGADLVLHGHNHRRSLARLQGPDGPVPIVGVASASAVPGSPAHRAAWHLFRLELHAGRLAITLEVRGLEHPGGSVARLSREQIA